MGTKVLFHSICIAILILSGTGIVGATLRPVPLATNSPYKEGVPNSERVCDGGCSGGQNCCSSTCVTLSSNSSHCGACGNSCGGNTCCSSVCVSTSTDTSNCGSCGNACAGGEDCCSGGCADLQSSIENCGCCGNSCKGTGSSPECCSGGCVDLDVDDNNCGGCGNACNTGKGESCTKGSCS